MSKVVTLKFSTISKANFELEASLSITVEGLKQKVYELKGAGYEPETLKLIFSGRILENSKKLSEYESLDFVKGRIVVLGKNPKNEVEAKKKFEEQEREIKKEEKAKQEEEKKKVGKVSSFNSPEFFDEPPININEIVKTIMALGVTEENAREYLRISRYNPDVAVNLILEKFDLKPFMGGTPNVEQNKKDETTTPVSTTKTVAAPPQTLNELTKHPHFAQLAKAVLSHPESSLSMLTQLRELSPGLLDEILSKPDEFYVSLLEHHKQGKPSQVAANQTASNKIELKVTPEENEVLKKLTEMGFPTEMVLQAYFACEKNEELTINFLLQQNEYGHASENEQNKDEKKEK